MSCLADEVEICDFCLIRSQRADFCLIRSQRADVVGVMMYEDICACP